MNTGLPIPFQTELIVLKTIVNTCSKADNIGVAIRTHSAIISPINLKRGLIIVSYIDLQVSHKPLKEALKSSK